MTSELSERVVGDGVAKTRGLPVYEVNGSYSIFSEQYLEKPVISGDYAMALSPTACTIGGIPVLDDF